MSDKSKKFAIGAILATFAGYVAGILTAPKSGKETRQDIKEATVQARTQAERKLKELHSELDTLIEKGKSTLTTLKDKAQEELRDVLGQAQTAKEKARTVLSVMHEGKAEDKDLQKAIEEVGKAIEHLKTYVKKDEQSEQKDK